MKIHQFKEKNYAFFESWGEILDNYRAILQENESDLKKKILSSEGASLVSFSLKKTRIEVLRTLLSKFQKLKYFQISLFEKEEKGLFPEFLETILKFLVYLESIDLDFSSTKKFESSDYKRISQCLGKIPNLREFILYFDRDWVLERENLEIYLQI
jgi:hypothetical protein